QAEDGIRDRNVTGVQTCALPIWIVTSSKNPWPLSEAWNAWAVPWKLPVIVAGRRRSRWTFSTFATASLSETPTWRLNEIVTDGRSEEHTSELQSRFDLVCRLLLE